MFARFIIRWIARNVFGIVSNDDTKISGETKCIARLFQFEASTSESIQR